MGSTERNSAVGMNSMVSRQRSAPAKSAICSKPWGDRTIMTLDSHNTGATENALIKAGTLNVHKILFS